MGDLGGRFKVSIIIPTYNRPDGLEECIQSILQQTIIPQEIIVVDDGDLGRLPCREECEKAGIEYIYIKKAEDQRGVVHSRNFGAEAASGDILFFVDDDMTLLPDYVEEVLRVYRDCDDGSLGGVGGVIVDYPKKNPLHRLLQRVFLNLGFQEGKVLPSGFSTDYGETGRPLKKITEVDILIGGVFSFRKEVFDEFRFDPRYQTNKGYAQTEDKEFCYRVSRKYRLLVNPEAKVNHMYLPKTNYNKENRGKAYVVSRYLFFKDNLSHKFWRKPLFYYSIFGYFFIRLATAIVSFNKSEWTRVKGILIGIRDISFRDVDHLCLDS